MLGGKTVPSTIACFNIDHDLLVGSSVMWKVL
jgi:hypothetical protein